MGQLQTEPKSPARSKGLRAKQQYAPTLIGAHGHANLPIGANGMTPITHPAFLVIRSEQSSMDETNNKL
jgi:hypothetical protein